jgi:hypothetical protein
VKNSDRSRLVDKTEKTKSLSWFRSGPGEHLAWCKKLGSFMKIACLREHYITFLKGSFSNSSVISDVYLFSMGIQ